MRAADGRAGRASPPEADVASGLSRLVQILGTVVAPTTLLTALFYYFGWMFSYWFFDYFGVNSTLLGLTTSDYLIRSVDGLFVPMTVLACLGLVALWGHRALRDRMSSEPPPRLPRLLVPPLAGAGLLLVTAGLASVFAETVLDRYLAAAPVSLALGVLVLRYVVDLWRSVASPGGPATADRTDVPRMAWTSVAEWAAVFTLVGVCLFWAATDYSGAVGRTRARQLARELPNHPDVVLYSERSLNLRVPGVREIRCQGADAAYGFRYDGLKLVLHSDNQYLFLPERWTPADGVAVLLPRTDSLRVEFVRAGANPSVVTAVC